MIKLLFLFFAFSLLQVSAQNKTSTLQSETSTTSSMLESLATDQVTNLNKILNLNKTQEEQVSGLVMSQLKSIKFQNLLGSIDRDAYMKSENNDELTEKVQNRLFLDKDFQKSMASVLDEEQLKIMTRYTPK